MQIGEQTFSALTQVGLAICLSAIAYGLHRLFFRNRLSNQSFLAYIGIRPTRDQLDRKFLMIWFTLIAFAFVSTILEFHFSDTFRKMLMSDNSPYGKILKNGFDMHACILGFIYCFIMAGASEEIFFRGFIARRLFSSLGFFRGNIIQALIFWLMHLVILQLVTGEWISFFQFLAFITSFGMGLILGYANFRKSGESIVPSWILHGSANFFTFLTLACIWPR